jgi:hypothetical protein
MGGPADETRLSEFFEHAGKFGRSVLLWIWRDDFEIAASAQRKKGVLRAAAWVNSAECGADAGMLFDEIDATLQIIAAKKDVIEHWRHLINQRNIGFLPVLSAKSSWREDRASG